MSNKTSSLLEAAIQLQEENLTYGLGWPPDVETLIDKLQEEIKELQIEISAGNKTRQAEELGDVLYTCCHVARFLSLDAEQALLNTIEKIRTRMFKMQEKASLAQRDLSSYGLEELLALWNSCK